MSGPPDKFWPITTKGMTDPATLATQLANAYSAGYTETPIIVPSPQLDGSTWLIVGGYGNAR